MIDLNSSEFDASSGGVAIFNGGKAGIVENVKVSISKKKAEDKENAPDYKIVFTDSSGAECNSSLWYIKEATQFSTVEQQRIKQGKILKHLIHAICGPNTQIPPFADDKAMLDGAMKLVRDSLQNAGEFRIFANYGTVEYRKKYIQPRSWVPFMESMTVPLDTTVLKVSDLDGMERLVEDSPVMAGAASASGNADEDDW
jgi:hypothetical protein